MSWDIKIYENKGKTPGTGLHNLEEKETIRGLTESQKDIICAILFRYKIVHSTLKVGK